jgi:hypothetical protein
MTYYILKNFNQSTIPIMKIRNILILSIICFISFLFFLYYLSIQQSIYDINRSNTIFNHDSLILPLLQRRQQFEYAIGKAVSKIEQTNTIVDLLCIRIYELVNIYNEYNIYQYIKTILNLNT